MEKILDIENTYIDEGGICFTGDDPCTLVVNDQYLHFPGGVAQIVKLFEAEIAYSDLDDQDSIIRSQLEDTRYDIIDNMPDLVVNSDDVFDDDSPFNVQADEKDASELDTMSEREFQELVDLLDNIRLRHEAAMNRD